MLSDIDNQSWAVNVPFIEHNNTVLGQNLTKREICRQEIILILRPAQCPAGCTVFQVLPSPTHTVPGVMIVKDVACGQEDDNGIVKFFINMILTMGEGVIIVKYDLLQSEPFIEFGFCCPCQALLFSPVLVPVRLCMVVVVMRRRRKRMVVILMSIPFYLHLFVCCVKDSPNRYFAKGYFPKADFLNDVQIYFPKQNVGPEIKKLKKYK